MTVALGILGPDFVLVAADTEEALGSAKVDRSKVTTHIRLAEDAHSAMLMSGAGDGPHIDALGQLLTRRVLKDPRIADDPLGVFDSAVERFYLKKIAPCHGLPDYERPDISLLIGYRGSDKRVHLFTSSLATVVEHDSFAVVGVGALVAEPILGRMIRARRTIGLRDAILVASYAVFQAKESVSGVGKRTQIQWATAAGALLAVPAHVQEKIEEGMRRYSNRVEPLVFRALTSDSMGDGLVRELSAARESWAHSLDETLRAGG